VRKALIAVLATMAVVVVPAGARAATIHTPGDGLVTQQGQPVLFDWAWDSDEYATSWIGLARSPDGP
jgi:hypothetical protein